MVDQSMTEQEQAGISGPRALKEPGDSLWCWQTISALQTQWKSLNFDLALYEKTWSEAEEHAVWDKVPYDSPYGSKAEMLRRLEIGDVPAARVRVAERAMDTRPLGEHGGIRSGQPAVQQVAYGSQHADYLTARIARDRPDIWERMKRGEFVSVAAAAREAGILRKATPKVSVGRDNSRLLRRLLEIKGREEFRALASEAMRLASENDGC